MSRPSFLCVFSISADPCDGFPRDSSLIIPLLSVAGFAVIFGVFADVKKQNPVIR